MSETAGRQEIGMEYPHTTQEAHKKRLHDIFEHAFSSLGTYVPEQHMKWEIVRSAYDRACERYIRLLTQNDNEHDTDIWSPFTRGFGVVLREMQKDLVDRNSQLIPHDGGASTLKDHELAAVLFSDTERKNIGEALRESFFIFFPRTAESHPDGGAMLDDPVRVSVSRSEPHDTHEDFRPIHIERPL